MCVCVFGLPPGSWAKLKPRKSDYGVPGGGMPSSQLMSAHLLLALFCTACPTVSLEANLLTIIACYWSFLLVNGGSMAETIAKVYWLAIIAVWVKAAVVSEVSGFADCQFAVRTPIMNDPCSASWVINMKYIAFPLYYASLCQLIFHF